jgi:thiol-disulfide isomerase/thioredoxin
MLPYSFFESALSYQPFLETYGSSSDRERWNRTRQAVVLTPDQSQVLQKFVRRMDILVLAGAWCGDCAGQCPAFERFADLAPCLNIRYLDRDEYPEAQKELQINGGNRVPVVVFYSEDGYEVARYGERTLTAYRNLAAQLGGDTCGSGIVTGDLLSGVVSDWLREFERVHWILRLSPRLRRIHND